MKLSVLMLAYNHERFIAQAIESVLMQKVDFDYELVIGEDCSTDGTRAICARYRDQHPGRIKLLAHKTNIGMMRNGMATYLACAGDYVANLEGDDYWTAPHKLQKQVEFLDAHPECVSCWHPVWVVQLQDGAWRETMEYPNQRWREAEIHSRRDLFAENFMPTCSVVYRNRVITEFPEWWSELRLGDWPFQILLARAGQIGMIDEVLAHYRMHERGVWSGMTSRQQYDASRKMLLALKPLLPAADHPLIERAVSGHSLSAVLTAVHYGRRAQAREIAREQLARDGWRSWRTALAAFAPPVFRACVWMKAGARRIFAGLRSC